MKIVALDAYTVNHGDLSWEPFSDVAEFITYDRTERSKVVERAIDADAILTNKVIIDAEIMAQLPQLKYIGVLATGYNVVDVEEASRRGIVVTNIPAYSTNSVAQKVFALILNITDSVDHYSRANREGRWSSCPDFCYWDEPLHEIAGKTLGIVGLGNIGMRVAKIALAFGMKVVSSTSKDAESLPEGIEKVTLDTLLEKSDVISLHCPLTALNKGFINKDALSRMKPNAILVNTGRGPLVVEQDVADALTKGVISAYAADVMESEPPSSSSPLLNLPNVYLTPHIAWATVEARVRLMDIALSNVKAFIDGKPINVVG